MGRSPNPFVKQVQNVVNIQYTTSSGHEHNFLNKGAGGSTSCSFARSFKSSYFNMDAKGSDLIFLEHSVNDAYGTVLSTDERRRCFESLILRIRQIAPNATIVALILSHVVEHELISKHYNLPQIYLGNITKYGAIRADSIHFNDIGSFLVCQAIGKLLENAEHLYNVSTTVKNSGAASYDDLQRLYEPAESFDWILNFGDGSGWTLPMGPLMESCFPSFKTAKIETNSSNYSEFLHSDHTGSCSETILAKIANQATQIFPCEGWGIGHDGLPRYQLS